MKFTKKLMSVLLVVLMLVTMALPAMADTPITITIDNAVPGHTYAAYQIFKGDFHEGILTHIEWSTTIDAGGLLAELQKSTVDSNDPYPLFTKDGANPFAVATTANDVAAV